MQSKLIMTKAEGTFDESMIKATFRLEVLPKGAYSFKFDANITVDLETFVIRVGLAFPLSNGTFDQSVRSSVADMCKYYKDKSSNMFLRMFFNGHFGNKHFPTTCPVKAGHYFMDDFQLNEDYLRVSLIETKFMVVIDQCTRIGGKLKCFANLKLYGELKDREKWEREVAKSGRK